MKKICAKCKEDKHEQCVTRDMSAKEYRCSCGCVGNPFVGICCVHIPKDNTDPTSQLPERESKDV